MELKRLVAEKDPTKLILSESKMRSSKIKWWKDLLGYTGMFVVDHKGRSGGLILLWKDPFDITVKSYTH